MAGTLQGLQAFLSRSIVDIVHTMVHTMEAYILTAAKAFEKLVSLRNTKMLVCPATQDRPEASRFGTYEPPAVPQRTTCTTNYAGNFTASSKPLWLARPI